MGEALGDGIRMIDVQSPVPGPNGKFATFHIPVLSKMLPKSFFFTAPVGSLVTLKGRIESHERFGLIIVHELDEIFTSATPTKKTVSRE